ncbi:MAG: hypothetical protein E6K20_09510 [Gammaproteobacteria bacterium]|nr:MAG: hypothetical protein E6K20_09510 [Gammaproteobacteria bacterium]
MTTFASSRTDAGALNAATPAAGAVPFVLNLCSSTTPMALAQTDLPELKRFTFVVSRRFEEGRERFRLHMGYFSTLAEAEEWLSVVREIYPGAWAGEAPGRKLRERATAAVAAQARHAAGPQPRIAPPPRRAPVVSAPPSVRRAAAAAPPTMPNPASVPVVHAAPREALRAAARAVAPPARPAAFAPAARIAKLAAARVFAPPAVRALSPVPARAPATQASGGSWTTSRGAKGAFEDSNVREVLAALADSSPTGETRVMHAPPPPRATLAGGDSLSDTQVLRMLEARGPEGSEPDPADVSHRSIPMLKPDDTGTRLALKEALVNNAPVSFAVQLQWSVQPADLGKVPPLAIFNAYTLYTVEGSRDGRKWYGLRLGFFSDAISAKQVAHYVRSEFASVAVVPVSPQEKARASDQDFKSGSLAPTSAARSRPEEEFKLMDDDTAKRAVSALRQGKPAAAATHSPKGPPRVPGRPVRPGPSPTASPRARARGGKVGARERRGPQTLEETLEILGASELTIDDGRGETINDTGVRHLRVEVQKNSPFTKLLERLSERLKKP